MKEPRIAVSTGEIDKRTLNGNNGTRRGKAKWRQAALAHIVDRRVAGVTASYRNARKIMMNAHYIMTPQRVTHRKNAKGEDIIYKKEF